MPDIQFTPTNGNGVIYVRSANDIPANPDPSIVYMLWDGVDYRTAVRHEVSSGQIKYALPFRTTWATRPAPSAVIPGAELQTTDYGNIKWISDGVTWKLAQGSSGLYTKFGLNDGSGHIAQISGVTSGTFAIPGGLKIPAYMINPNTKVSVQVEITKVGGNSTATASVTLGTLNSASDSSVSGQTIATGTGMQALMSCAARFGASTTKFNTRDYVGEGVSQASVANVMKDRTSNIDTSVDMYVNINISGANAADVFNLVSVQVKLEA